LCEKREQQLLMIVQILDAKPGFSAGREREGNIE
jgi:hypothetical protein